MLIYYLLYSSILFSAIFHCDTVINKKAKKLAPLFFILISLFLITFVGFRKLGVGADDFNYYSIFKNAQLGFQRKEFAFYIISTFLNSINVIFIVFASISIFFKTSYIFLKNKYFGVIFLLYFSSSFFYTILFKLGLLLRVAYYYGYFILQGKKSF